MTKAFDLGSRQHSWWPDWRGQCVAIVACGPTIKQMDLSVLRDRIHVVAIKEIAVEFCPWADACYGCDSAWWVHRDGLPKFKGLKFFHGVQISGRWPGTHKVEIELSKDEMLVDYPLKIGNGGCSGFQALNLVVQFGATDVIVVGYDLHERGGPHWYGRNKWLNASNPAQSNFNRWNKGFNAAKKSLDRLGVNVVNVSPDTQLDCFSKKPLIEVMEEWGL